MFESLQHTFHLNFELMCDNYIESTSSFIYFVLKFEAATFLCTLCYIRLNI